MHRTQSAANCRTGAFEQDAAELGRHEAQSSGLAARCGAVMLDYLRCRLPDTEEVRRAVAAWLGPMVRREFGWRGWYDMSWHVLEGGVVAACSSPDRAEVEGLLIDLPGKACGCLGARLPAFLEWCLTWGRVTRADFAMDDRAEDVAGGLLSLKRITDAEAAGGLVTRWQGLSVIIDRNKGRTTGWTVYVGSRDGESMVRFYDKAAERGVKGHWVRCEFETKGKLADALCREYFSAGAGAIIGQLNRRMRFAVPSGLDSNKRRWRTAEWWTEFLGSVEPGPSLLAGEEPETTVSTLKAYAERQAGPALSTVLDADGGDLSWLFGMLSRSRERLKPRHYAALARAMAQVEPGYLV